MKQEKEGLLGLIRSLQSDIEDLKRQSAGHEKTCQDKVAVTRVYLLLTTREHFVTVQ